MNTTAYYGFGDGTFSSSYISLQMLGIDGLIAEFNIEPVQCSSGNPGQTFSTATPGGLRDLTGDGIPDLVVINYNGANPAPQLVYVGTGAGFASTPVAVGGPGFGIPDGGTTDSFSGIALSGEFDWCGGSASKTQQGVYDVDGDGKADYVGIQGAGSDGHGVLEVWMLSGGSAPGIPEAGLLTSIDNGYGATTSISYTSAKLDTTTQHAIPQSEIVVSSVSVSASAADPVAPTYYAYGNASMIYDGVADAFTFPGYGATVTLQNQTDLRGNLVGNATLVQRWGLTGTTSTDWDRFGRLLLVGQDENVDLISNYLGQTPWALLSVDAVSYPFIIDRSTPQYGHQLLSTTSTGDKDCLDYLDPYDFDDSYAQAAGHYDLCESSGYMVQSQSYHLRGTPLPSSNNVITTSEVLSFDSYGQPTSVLFDNDITRGDDDLCVDTTYATPSGSGAPVLNAPASRKIWGCAKNNVTYAIDTYDYDGLPAGSVTNGLKTGASRELHALNDGSLESNVRLFDATYDAIGNVSTVARQRDTDHATQQTALTYDAFELVRTSNTTTATGTPTLTTSVTYDPLSLLPTASQDANGTLAGANYDGFDRVIATTVTPPATSGVSGGELSATEYDGFSAGSARSIKQTTYDEPLGSGGAASHVSVTSLDSFGRAYETDVDLGSDYGSGSGAALVAEFHKYDLLGRVAFSADPHPASQLESATYGTSRFFNVDGTPLCFVRATGQLATPTSVSDDSSETYPTCFSHYYSNSVEYKSVSKPDANLPGSPQFGVQTIDARTAIGWPVSRSTQASSPSAVTLDYVAFGEDHFGHINSMTRYGAPSGLSLPVTSTWSYDSVGHLLEKADPSGAPIWTTYDSWGEATQTAWIVTTPSVVLHNIVTNYDALGRVVQHEEQDNGSADAESVMTYTYDAANYVSPEVTQSNMLGRLSTATSPSGTVAYSYDVFGGVAAEVNFDEARTRYVEIYARRPDHSLAAFDLYLPDDAYADEHVAYQFDSADRTVNATYKTGSVTTTLFQANQLDPLGRILDANYGVAHYTADYAPDGRQLLQDVAASARVGVHNYSRGITFTAYDAVGRELSREETQHNLFATSTSMSQTYDQLGRLQSYSSTVGPTSWQYTYDPLGNIQALVVNDSGGSDAEGAALANAASGDRDQVCNVAYGVTSTSGFTCDVEYDAVGNVVSEATRSGTRSLTYFDSGQVKSISDAESTASFRYDPFGNVQELDVTGSTNDDRRDRRYGNVVEVSGVSSPVIARNIPVAGLVASLRGAGGSWLFAFGEGRGTRFTIDQGGHFLQDVRYQPFGEATSAGESPPATLYLKNQWNGGDNLAAFNLVQVGARIYDPVIGHFLSRDPLTYVRTASVTNPYSFASNDPINFIDPTGCDDDDDGPEGAGPDDTGPGGSLPSPSGGSGPSSGGGRNFSHPDTRITGNIHQFQKSFDIVIDASSVLSGRFTGSVQLAGGADNSSDFAPFGANGVQVSVINGVVDWVLDESASHEQFLVHNYVPGASVLDYVGIEGPASWVAQTFHTPVSQQGYIYSVSNHLAPLGAGALAAIYSTVPTGTGPLKEYEVTTYRNASDRRITGDDLSPHEILQNTTLKQFGLAPKRLGTPASEGNPAIMIKTSQHAEISALQTSMDTAAMTPWNSIMANFQILLQVGVPFSAAVRVTTYAVLHAWKLGLL